jgi:hypothetical protein
MGAVITLSVSKYRSRRQPIGYSIETIEVFKRHPDFPTLQAFLDIGEDPETGQGHAHAVLSNFSIVRVKLVNKGNQDIEEFKVGINLREETDAFDIKVETGDRHHAAAILTAVNFADSKNELDFLLRPFNRTDSYVINVYVTYKDSVGKVSLSSPHSTTFVEIGTPMDESKQHFIFTVLMALAVSDAVFFLTIIPREWISDSSQKWVTMIFMLVFASIITPIVAWRLFRTP